MALMPAFQPKESSAFLCEELASTAAALFQGSQPADADKLSLQNIYRLLEMYRFDAFVGYSPKGVLELRRTNRGTEVNVAEGEILKRALDAAKNTVFPGVEKQAVVERLERLVSETAKQGVLDAGEKQKATRFFQELAAALKAA